MNLIICIAITCSKGRLGGLLGRAFVPIVEFRWIERRSGQVMKDWKIGIWLAFTI